MNVLGVILARAGSEGLKGKHLRMLCGKPVIEYTFDYAKHASRLTKTVLTTDCPQLRQMAIARGLTAIVRPTELATSFASVQDVMLHALAQVESNGTFHADALVVLYGNVPLRGDGVIDRAIEHLEKTGCDSVRTFCPVGKWHPAWMSKLNGDVVQPLKSGSIHRRQDLEPVYLHDGAVVAVSRASMLRGRENPNDPHAFFGIDRRGILTEIGETVEIDHPRDLFLAEAMLRERSIDIENDVARGRTDSPSPGTPGEGRGGGDMPVRKSPTLTLPRSTGRGENTTDSALLRKVI